MKGEREGKVKGEREGEKKGERKGEGRGGRKEVKTERVQNEDDRKQVREDFHSSLKILPSLSSCTTPNHL